MTDLLTRLPDNPRADNPRADSSRALSVPSDQVYVLNFDAPPASWLADVIRRMEAIAHYAANWDGAGARPISTAAKRSAAQLVGAIAQPSLPSPTVGATPEGGIQFEWHRGGWDVEVEVRRSGALEIWGESREGGETLWAESLDDIPVLIGVLTTLR